MHCGFTDGALKRHKCGVTVKLKDIMPHRESTPQKRYQIIFRQFCQKL